MPEALSYALALVNAMLRSRAVHVVSEDMRRSQTVLQTYYLAEVVDFLITQLVEKGYDPRLLVAALDSRLDRWRK